MKPLLKKYLLIYLSISVIDMNSLTFFIAEADGMIAAICTDDCTSGNVRLLTGLPEDNYLTFPELEVVEKPHNNYKLALGVDAQWYESVNNNTEQEAFKEMHEFRTCSDYQHMSEKAETLCDVYMHIPKNFEYKNTKR
ncbi:MAG: hypothetical protein HFE63_05270 [Clostridiales bacterium]|nr:hypothetical protein [Clostridiales bacterium]